MQGISKVLINRLFFKYIISFTYFLPDIFLFSSLFLTMPPKLFLCHLISFNLNFEFQQREIANAIENSIIYIYLLS